VGSHDGQGVVEEGGLVSLLIEQLHEWAKSDRDRNDAKSVSIPALAAFHPNTKVQSAALHFFLGSETDGDREGGSSDEEEGIRETRRDVRKLEHKVQVANKGRKTENALKKAKQTENKVRISGWYQRVANRADNVQRRADKVSGINAKPNFPALELLHDPQTFGEKLYDNLHKHGQCVVSINCTPADVFRQAVFARPQNSHHAAPLQSHGNAQAMCSRFLQLHHQVSFEMKLRD
jgi:hypothetical protein